ncbi:MAG: acetate--CoA ligase family protein [Magnetovibrio sp.]|nr:acetate--CoA ligase family protein [Magnetovibrio sp.]
MDETIEALLFPKSIAVIGASPDANKLNGRPFHFLRRDGYAGKLFPVNPKYDEIDGVTCYADVASLPEAPDMAIVAVNAARATETVAALGKKGTPVAVIFSSGFGEMGEEGRRLEAKLAATAAANGIRICGPNNLGLINAFERMPATFSQYADEPPKAGPVAFASQSGAFGTGIAAMARSRGLGIGYFVNTGNQADITLMEALNATLDDDRIKVASAYLEGLTHGDQLIDLADKSIATGKPLVVVKVGRKSAGAKAAASHTGSLAGEDAVFDGVARQHGIIRARNEEHMLDMVAAFANCGVPEGRGVAMITQSGGSGVLMADRAEELGLDVPELAGETRERLKSVIPDFGALGNPVDVTGQFLAEPKILKDSVRIVLEDPAVHVGIVWLQLMHGYSDVLVNVFREIKAAVEKPFIVCWLEAPAAALAALRDEGICVLGGTERAVDAAAGLIAFGDASRRIKAGGREMSARPMLAPSSDPAPVPAVNARERLAAAGLPVVECALADSPESAVAAAGDLGYPVAVKIESPDIQHKMDVGGVRLGLDGAEAVCAAAAEILENVADRAPDAAVDGLLVQAMALAATEMVLGLRRDPAFGPVIMVGLGGVFVEVLKDVAFARAPVSDGDAEQMLDSLTGAAVLAGARGQSPADRKALVAAITALSRFALDNPDVLELDLNPVFAGPDGVVSVDWLMMAAGDA